MIGLMTVWLVVNCVLLASNWMWFSDVKAQQKRVDRLEREVLEKELGLMDRELRLDLADKELSQQRHRLVTLEKEKHQKMLLVKDAQSQDEAIPVDVSQESVKAFVASRAKCSTCTHARKFHGSFCRVHGCECIVFRED